jgi:hypothetical protein
MNSACIHFERSKLPFGYQLDLLIFLEVNDLIYVDCKLAVSRHFVSSQCLLSAHIKDILSVSVVFL